MLEWTENDIESIGVKGKNFGDPEQMLKDVVEQFQPIKKIGTVHLIDG